jgi:hypothetical protein
MTEPEQQLLDRMESTVDELANGDPALRTSLETAFFKICTFLDGVQVGRQRLTLSVRTDANALDDLIHDEWSRRRWGWSPEDR